MYDFVTFITGTPNFYCRNSCFGRWNHQLSPGELHGIEHQMSSEILTPLQVVFPQYWDQTNFSADGIKAFEIGFNVLNLVFGDESVMEDSEAGFVFALSRTTASHIL